MDSDLKDILEPQKRSTKYNSQYLKIPIQTDYSNLVHIGQILPDYVSRAIKHNDKGYHSIPKAHINQTINK